MTTDSQEARLGGALAEYLAGRIPRYAVNRHRRFPQVPAEDFEQEMWAKALSNPAKFRKLFDQGHYATIWLELLNAATALGYDDDRYRRAQKAAAAGYSPDDEEFYSIGMLRVLLPVLIEADFEPANAVERATSATDAAGVRIHGSDQSSATETYAVILIDVAMCFKKLKPHQQKVLRDYYGLNQDDTEQGRWERESFASSHGMTLKAYQRRVDRALDALERLLGGKSPWLRARRNDERQQA